MPLIHVYGIVQYEAHCPTVAFELDAQHTLPTAVVAAEPVHIEVFTGVPAVIRCLQADDVVGLLYISADGVKLQHGSYILVQACKPNS